LIGFQGMKHAKVITRTEDKKGKFNFSNFFVDKKFDLVLSIANVTANVCGNVYNSR